MWCAMYVDVSKDKSASILEIFQNSDLHEVFKPKNDPKRSRNTLKKSNQRGESAHILLRGHKHVIQGG